MSARAPDIGLFGQSLRFLMTGLLNTGVGFSVILALLWAGVGDIPANVAGFATGLLCSFLINRAWTFQQANRPDMREISRFLLAFGLSYSVNLTIILAGRSLGYGGSGWLHLAGVIAYSLCFFALSKFLVYGTSGRDVSDVREVAARHAPELVLVAIAVTLLPGLLFLPLTHDVSWQFWIARQMMNGVPLYERIVEVNPPLWFWMALPFEWLGTVLSVDPTRLYIAAIIALAVVSSATFGKLAQPDNPGRRLVLMAGLLLIFLIAPLYDFGQREHLVAILGLPYCALVVRRMHDEPVSLWSAVLIGLMAASGFALKHYFVLVPIGLEVWLMVRSRRLFAFVRPESLVLLASAALYAGAVLVLAPQFLSSVVPLVGTLYDGDQRSFMGQLALPEVLIWGLAVVSMLHLRREASPRTRTIGDMLTLVGACFVIGYFLQAKGWQYHALPATIILSLVPLHYLLERAKPWPSLARFPLAGLAASGFLLLGVYRGPYTSDWASNMNTYFDRAQRGESVLVLTHQARRIFPFVEDRDLVWSSRYMSFWMVTKIAKAETAVDGKVTKDMARLAAAVRENVIEDMKCHPPALIVSQIRDGGNVIAPDRFHVTDFFRRAPEFRKYLAANYELETSDQAFETYRRTTPPRPEGDNCVPIY